MFELFSRRRRAPQTTSLVIAAVGGALAASTAAVLTNAPRRARLRDRATSTALHFGDLLDKARRDARSRAAGIAAHAAARRNRGDGGDVPDHKLVARVRATLGHYASHPHAVDVHATNGHVILSGPVLLHESHRLVHAVRKVPGVREVESRLEEHATSEDIPGLQGVGGRRHVPELLQEHWTPSLRIGAGMLGAIAVGAGLRRIPSAVGIGLSGLGALILARASFDKPFMRILGIGGERRSIDFHKTISIHAPVEQVFAYWADFERFPRFMDHVEHVKMTDGRRSHWKVRGPFGAVVEWVAETTSFVPNERIAWKSVDGSLIKNAGIIRFEPADEGRATRLDVRLSYNPVAGYLGHGIAALFRVDPKKSLDDDLLRLKSLLEEGSATAHGHKITRDTLPVAPVGIDDAGVPSER